MVLASSMETSFVYDSEDAELKLCGKENFVNDDNWMLTVEGTLGTSSGKRRSRVSFRKKIFPQPLTRVRFGAICDSARGEKGLLYNVGAKKSFELTEDGLMLLDLKADVDYQPRARTVTSSATCEMSYKIFNFTEDQDLKLKVGYGTGKEKVRNTLPLADYNHFLRWYP